MSVFTRAMRNVCARANLDAKTKYEIVRLLSKLNTDQGTTIIMVTHDSQIGSRAGRMLFLNDGRLMRKEKLGTHLTEGRFACPNCGKKIRPDDIFCPRCGKEL